QKTLDISKLSTGIYVLEVQAEKGQFSRRLVIE
ncbi:MAG: hypothetical protein C0592_12465, partial [Marinilabiliales bacterium]